MAKSRAKSKMRGARRPVRDLAAKSAARVKGGDKTTTKLYPATASGKHFAQATIVI